MAMSSGGSMSTIDIGHGITAMITEEASSPLKRSQELVGVGSVHYLALGDTYSDKSIREVKAMSTIQWKCWLGVEFVKFNLE